jgi:cobalamin biosynthesis protein CobT
MKGITRGAEYRAEAIGVSHTFSRRGGDVKVVFRGDKAATDGSTIIYPAIADSAEMSDNDVSVMRGYADHEAAHIRITDARAMQEAAEENPMLATACNIIDDLRVDSDAIDKYSGAMHNLDTLVNESWQGMEENVGNDDHYDQLLGGLALGRQRLGMKAQPLQNVIDKLSPENRKVAEQVADDVLKMPRTKEGTHDLIEYTRNLLNLPPNPKQPPPPQSCGEGEGEGEGSPKDGQGEGEEPTKQADAQSFQNAAGGEWGDGSGAINAIAERLRDTDDTDPWLPYDTNNWSFRDAKEVDLDRSGSMGVVGRLRTQLEAILQSKARRNWQGGYTEGKLDRTRHVGAVLGQQEVWKKKAQTPIVNTAVSLLIDMSGSMCGDKAELAGKCCIALVQALQKIKGLEVEVLGYDSTYGNSHPDPETDKLWNVYSCFDQTRVTRFKAFDDPLNARTMRRLAAIEYSADGGTPTYTALSLAYTRLMARRKPRKVMMILTDGAANSCSHRPDSKEHLMFHLKKIIADHAARGVETMAIGIQSDYVRHYFPVSAVVNEINDLPKVAMGEIRRMVLGQKRRNK